MFSFSTNFCLKEFVKTFIRPNLISYFNTGLSAAHFRSLTAEGSHAWKYQRRSLGKPQSALCRLIARWHTLTLRAFWEGRQNRFVVVHIHNTGCHFCVCVVMLVNYFRSHMGRRVVQKIYSEQNSEWHLWPQKFISVPWWNFHLCYHWLRFWLWPDGWKEWRIEEGNQWYSKRSLPT